MAAPLLLAGGRLEKCEGRGEDGRCEEEKVDCCVSLSWCGSGWRRVEYDGLTFGLRSLLCKLLPFFCCLPVPPLIAWLRVAINGCCVGASSSIATATWCKAAVAVDARAALCDLVCIPVAVGGDC